MYFLSVEGAMIRAEYEKDNGQAKFRRVRLERDAEHDPVEGGEHFEVVISNTENKNNLREIWIVLYGTPRQIIWNIRSNLPMAMLETDAIFRHLESVGAEQTTLFTYLLEEPSHVVQHTPLYRELRLAQREIVADILDRNPSEVHILALSDTPAQVNPLA